LAATLTAECLLGGVRKEVDAWDLLGASPRRRAPGSTDDIAAELRIDQDRAVLVVESDARSLQQRADSGHVQLLAGTVNLDKEPGTGMSRRHWSPPPAAGSRRDCVNSRIEIRSSLAALKDGPDRHPDASQFRGLSPFSARFYNDRIAATFGDTQMRQQDLFDEHPLEPRPQEPHWAWRHRMAEQIAAELPRAEMGVAGLYLTGSTRNALAGPASDIDLLVHFRGSDEQLASLRGWLDRWSRALSRVNRRRTGQVTEGLLDIHIITDEDIARQTSYASKITSRDDRALRL